MILTLSDMGLPIFNPGRNVTFGFKKQTNGFV